MHALARLALRHPRATLATLAVASAVVSLGLPSLRTDAGYRAFLGSEHSSVHRFDGFLERFGGGLPVAIAWQCAASAPCGSVFDPTALRMAESVVASLEATSGVRRTASPATTGVLVPTPDGFTAERLIRDGTLSERHGELAARAIRDPLWVGNLVSSDGRVGAIVVELASSDSELGFAFFDALERALAPFEARGFEFHLVGGPVDFVVAAGELEEATLRLVPIVALLVGGLLWGFVRSVWAVAVVLITLGVAVLWTLGTMGWVGWPANTITQALPPLVLVVGSCNAIHVLARFTAELRPAGPADARRQALERATADVGGPCLIASATTAGGFLSFGTSDMESFVRFGILAALGVAFGLVLCFTLLPVLLLWAPPRRLPSASVTRAWERGGLRLVDIVRARAVAILVAAGTLGVVCGVAVPQLRVDASFEDLYGRDSRVVRWVHFVEENLRAPETLEIEIGLPEDQRAESPEVLRELARFETLAASVDGLGRVHSLLGPLARIHRLVRDDDPAFEGPAETAAQNRSLLHLMTLDDATALDAWMTPDRRGLRVSIEATKVPQDQLRRMVARVDAWLAEELPVRWTASATGAAVLVHEMVGEIERTQRRSFAFAAVVVLVLVGVFLRSLAWALLAMIPTGLPVLVTLGAMAYLGLHLDVGSAMVAAVVIGIAIDDSVHLLVQYRRRRAAGSSPSAAIESAVRHVLRALVTTSAALAIGFLSLMASPWSSISQFGVISGIAIAGALVADLVVLPALILVASRVRGADASAV